MNRISKTLILSLGLAALMAGSVDAWAQGGGGGGGGRGGRGGGRGGFNADPAAQAERYRASLEVADDTEWSAIRALIVKVIQARSELNQFTAAGRGGGGRGGTPTTTGGAGAAATASGTAIVAAQPNATIAALQTALESGGTDAIKTAMQNFRQARKAAEEKLTSAQDALQKVLKVKQEAVALRANLVR